MKKAGLDGKKFVTLKEAIYKIFMAGVMLGFNLGGFGERVAPMVAGEKDPKEIETILRMELAAVFKEFKNPFEEGKERPGR